MDILKKIKMAWHSLFLGMKGADDIIVQDANYGSGTQEIVQQASVDHVMNDFLTQQETQRMKERRDEYYRTFKESDKYKVEVEGLFDKEGNDLKGEVKVRTTKKVRNHFLKRIKVYNPENLEIRTVQDNKLIQKHSNIDDYTFLLHPTEKESIPLITVTRDGFTPRFELETYANKVVVRTINETECYVDFYTTMYASQFGKVDALFIAELNRIREQKLMRSDTTSFKEIDFISDKAFNTDDLCLFKYDNIEYKGIELFDGNFVLTFKCHVVADGTDITEKYKMKSLDKKLETNAPRDGVATNIFAAQRKAEKEEINFETTTLKL